MPGRIETIGMRHLWPDEKPGIPEPSAVRTIPGAQDIELDNGQKMRQLLTKEDISSHLCLLGAFKQLYQHVVSYDGSDTDVLKGNDAFTVFVARAVWRADRWFRTLTSAKDLGNHLPPPDVLLVWHSYLLNPRRYFEDGRRWNPVLLDIGDLPLDEIAATIDPATFTFMEADPVRVQHFTQQTSLPFGVERPQKNDKVEINCPCCAHPLQDVFWWKGESATGYAQSGFEVTCTECNRNITREVMGLRKLAEDVERIKNNPETNTLAHLFASPKYGIPTEESLQGSKQVNAALVENIAGFGEDFLGWDASRLKPFIQKCVEKTKFNHPYFIDRCCRSYSFPEQFSVEMRGAVTRQETTISEMFEVKWSDPCDLSINDKILSKAIRSYHMSLEFIHNRPDQGLVPTIVLDLAWHTHLLFHQSYRTCTLEIVESVVEHDDDVRFEEAVEHFKQTQKAWKDYFGTEYCFEWDGQTRPDLADLAAKHASCTVAQCDMSPSMIQEEQNPVTKVPPELWSTIFKAVRDRNITQARFRRADVRSILCTCRTFHDIGLPLAYERIYVHGMLIGKGNSLIYALDSDERKRRSVRELALVAWNDRGWHSVRPGGSEEMIERFKTMERVIKQLNNLRIVHTTAMRLSPDTLEHLINVPSLRELWLRNIDLPNEVQLAEMNLSLAKVTEMKIMKFKPMPRGYSQPSPSYGLGLLRIKALRELTIEPNTVVEHYQSFRRLFSTALPLEITKLHLVTSDPWGEDVYDPAFAKDLLQDCPDLEELEIHGRPSTIDGVPVLSKLKRFRGSAEAALVFCRGNPVEDMTIGRFGPSAEVHDLPQIIYSSSAALLQIKIMGIVWNPQIISTIASLCSELEALEVIATQEKPIDLSSSVLLLQPLTHLNRLRLEGRKILGQFKSERWVLQQLATERICPMLKEAQFHEERYWGRRDSNSSWSSFKLSPGIEAHP